MLDLFLPGFTMWLRRSVNCCSIETRSFHSFLKSVWRIDTAWCFSATSNLLINPDGSRSKLTGLLRRITQENSESGLNMSASREHMSSPGYPRQSILFEHPERRVQIADRGYRIRSVDTAHQVYVNVLAS